MADETILLIDGPPSTFCRAALSTPYSTAWRTGGLPIAPPASGLRRLNQRYGLSALFGQMCSRWSWLASIPGMDVGGTGRSPRPRSAVFAWKSAISVCEEPTPMVTAILFTYWWRSGSDDCFHAGFFVRVIDLPGTYEVIW